MRYLVGFVWVVASGLVLVAGCGDGGGGCGNAADGTTCAEGAGTCQAGKCQLSCLLAHRARVKRRISRY